MAGDGQMDPADLPALLDPVVEGRADYAKGNRLVTGEAWQKTPPSRYLGNSVLTFLTKIASGYWHVTDSQTGYTALNQRALKLLPLESIYPRYGMPNDFLVTLNIYNMRVADVPVNPVYNIGEESGIRPATIVFPLSLLLLRLFFRRMWQKYVVRDFHPLVMFYMFGLFLLLLDIPLGIRLFYYWLGPEGFIPKTNALTIVFCTLLGFQSLLFAMLFDMEANRERKAAAGADESKPLTFAARDADAAHRPQRHPHQLSLAGPRPCRAARRGERSPRRLRAITTCRSGRSVIKKPVPRRFRPARPLGPNGEIREEPLKPAR
jgi:hypothetical protein